MNPAENTRSVVVERVFSHPLEKVWRALTQQPLLSQWLMQSDFEPVVGRRFQFWVEPTPQWDGVIDCEVLVVDPLKQLSYSCSALGLDSIVILTLSESDGGTQVRMEQSGFAPGQERAFQGATHGWQRFLGALERLLEGGAM